MVTDRAAAATSLRLRRRLGPESIAAEELRFEYAAKLRDEIKELRRELLAGAAG